MSESVRLGSEAFTSEQKREIALRYVGLRKGQKSAYAASLGLSGYRIRLWVSALADGDLDKGKFPRHTGSMTRDDVVEIRRLTALLDAKDRQLEKLRKVHAEALALKDSEIETLGKVADALGKAITVLHDRGEPCGKAERS